VRFDYLNVPIFIVCRDKLSPLVQLVEWLERHGYQRLLLVDNASTYPPLLDYFERTAHRVVRHDQNLGPYDSIWSSGIRDRYAPESYFVVTDCDVLPDSGCPGDAVAFFHWALSRFPSFVKAGFGLRIDDLPECNELAESVRRWERHFWTLRFALNLYMAPIDTTFALYRPRSSFNFEPAIRTGKPYVARHQPWYVDTQHRTGEDLYYREHADPRIGHWERHGDTKPGKSDKRSLKAKVQWRAHAMLRMEQDRTVPRRYRPGLRRALG